MKIYIITIISLIILLVSMCVIKTVGVDPPKHNSLLNDYSKLDIQTQVVQDVGIIEEE